MASLSDPTNFSPLAKREQAQGVSIEVMNSEEMKGQFVEDPIDIMNSKEHIEKFKRYEAEFKQCLTSKYFSEKIIFGGNMFDTKMNIDGQTITASRFPPYQSRLDPVCFMELINKGLSSSAETPTASASYRKTPSA